MSKEGTVVYLEESKLTVTIFVKLAWWVYAYAYCLRLFSFITGMEPDVEKFSKLAGRGTSAWYVPLGTNKKVKIDLDTD